MKGSVTVHMAGPAERIWELVSDVTMIGRFSPETFEAEWVDGATGPAVGARFRGHVRRLPREYVYWTDCEVTACEPGREFGFAVMVRGRAINNWHYLLVPAGDGTDVTESFRLTGSPLLAWYRWTAGPFRTRTNLRDMRATLERVRDVVEAG